MTSPKAQTKLHMGIICPMTKKNHSDFLLQGFEAMCELGLQVSVLAEGDEDAQKKCFELSEQYPEQFHILESVPRNKNRLLREVDVMVFSSKPDWKTVKEMAKNEIVSIVPEGSGLQNFNAQTEQGNAFTFAPESFWGFASAIVRASENFQFQYDWKNIKTNVRELAL
jgi:glycogen synthase